MFDFKALFSYALQHVKMNLGMPSSCFSDPVLTICRRRSVYTLQLQASDMGYELLCLLDQFVLLDRITICSWASRAWMSWCLIQNHEQNGCLEQNAWKDFLRAEYKLTRLVLPSSAHLFTVTLIAGGCVFAVACFVACKCFHASAFSCLEKVVSEVGKKIGSPLAELLK